MNRINIALSPMLLVALLGCHSTCNDQESVDGDTSRVASLPSFADQTRLVNWFTEHELADKNRALVHLSHVCNLLVDDQIYAVIDMRELVKGAQVARGVNQIVLLNTELQAVNKIEYGSARPLFCEANKLHLYDSLILDGSSTEGNVLEFGNEGSTASVRTEDLNTKLPLR